MLKSYDRDHLLNIALPLGGIGTGTVSLGGRGELRDWEIMNVPGKGYNTVVKGNDAPFFAIYTRDKQGSSRTKALLGPLDDAEYQHMEGRSVNHHGLPRFRNASFSTTYPFGLVHLSDPGMPVQVRILGFNPLIPGDADASGIPIAILQYEVENLTEEELRVSIAGSMRNFIGKDGREVQVDWKGDQVPVGAVDNRNTFREDDLVHGIYMYSEGVDRNHPAWGTMALTTPKEEKSGISWRTSSIPNAWSHGVLDFWDDFSADGSLQEKSERADQDPMASLAVSKILAAGEKRVFTFYLTWHFPNRQTWGSWSAAPETRVGNYYTTRYGDAWAIIEKEADRLPSLTEKTLDFVNAMMRSTYPDVVKEAVLFNLSTLRSQTVFRTEDGKMFGWEGIMDRFGSCYGSCTHVWNYENATAFLFGDLARSMREVEFGHATHESGLMSFRVNLPLEHARNSPIAAADGQMGTIMKFYREWQLSGDQAFLELHWENVKAALAFAWIKGGWDADQDGMMEGVQHNTMDIEYFGPNPQMQFWYLGALKSASRMALAMEDREFAATCRKLYEQGSVLTDSLIFNGEYYYQRLIPVKSKKDIAFGLTANMGSEKLENPDYQLMNGCLVDQLVGQYMAHVLDLGYLADRENIRSALRSVYKYNRRDDMSDHFNNMRSYAMGDEKALLMASWPHGGRPVIPFPYWSEVMTGFEYTAGVGMLYEGMEEEGMEVIGNIRARYNGSRRNPFDEAECGHHYARAMASWSSVLALSGFHYSGVEKRIEFTDKPGNYFWSNGSAWGECVVKENEGHTEVDFSVLHGAIQLERFQIGTVDEKVFDALVNLVENEHIHLRF
ncbi:MAG: GH116 family glycosyl-hydrolase [Bacteroidota bacterium]|nr:GH116 family glycosyl-hydrolase [Bacteroidota bacterium]